MQNKNPVYDVGLVLSIVPPSPPPAPPVHGQVIAVDNTHISNVHYTQVDTQKEQDQKKGFEVDESLNCCPILLSDNSQMCGVSCCCLESGFNPM